MPCQRTFNKLKNLFDTYGTGIGTETLPSTLVDFAKISLRDEIYYGIQDNVPDSEILDEG